ncbi:glycosyltransferase [Nitrospira sp. Kam-Ns4a]
MRIALINSPSLTVRPISRSMAGGLGFDSHAAMLLPPLDLAIWAASLRQHGAAVQLLDADPLGLDAASTCAHLEGTSWDVLIATVSLPTWTHDTALLADLRRRHPTAKVFGKTAVQDPGVLQTLLRHSGADLMIYGEADLSIGDLVAGRTRRGCAWLEHGIVQRDPGEPVQDLNRLPVAARDLLPNARYRYPLLGQPVATLQTSRGCPYPCRYYCPYPLVEGTKWRAQSPDRIVSELRTIVEDLGITKLYFRDATFTLNQARIIQLCERIREAGWALEWACETRVDCLSDPLLEQMRAAGCTWLLIGVETGDERVMQHRHGKKGLTVPKLAHLRRQTRQLGIRLHYLLMVGLPQETRESIVETYELIQRDEPDSIGVTVITPYPGTPLYTDAQREGWIESFDWQDYGGHQLPMHTPHLTREDLLLGKQWLEDGFAIQQRRQPGGAGDTQPSLARQHYRQLLRWAYRLETPIARIQQAAHAAANAAGLEGADSARRDGAGPARSGEAGPPRSGEADPARRGEADPARSSVPGGASAPPRLSVVIPTYNRQTVLPRTLAAFAAQTLPADQFEVIVVDDGSSDETPRVLQQIQTPYALRCLTQAHQGANAARNLGIEAARGEIVVFTGDDMIPEPAFLEAHLTFHQQHPAELDAMLGFIDWSPAITVTPLMRYIVSPEGGQQFAFHEVRNGQADFRLFYTSNVSIKRSLLGKPATWFDPAFTYPAYDDIELGYRLTRQGLRLQYNPKAVTRHHHEITVEGFAARQYQAGRMAVRFAAKHPDVSAWVLPSSLLQQTDRSTDEAYQAQLAAVLEAERLNLTTLGAVRINGQRGDHVYAQTILYPLYGALLQAAYERGVRDEIRARNGEAGPARSKEAGPAGHRKPAAHPYTASIIIPVFNKVELTRQCLTALAQVTHGVTYEVIVVDNASSDETPAFLRSLGGDVQIIRNPDNRGFATACNQGAHAARGQYLVFLNNDTIPLPGWLTALVDEAEQHPEVAIVGSRLLYPDGTIQHAGIAFSRTWFRPYHLYRGFPADAAVVNRRRDLQAVTAACCLVRREAYEAVGGFDEAYRNGFEDVDLCLRIRDRGGRIVYQPRSVLYHLESQTEGRFTHDEANGHRWFTRWSQSWWLPDEDLLTVPDGYACRLHTAQGLVRTVLEPLRTAQDRAQWAHVAAVQRHAQQRDLVALRAALANPDDWPAEVSVLRWAAFVCKWAGIPAQAAPFWRRLLMIEEAPDARLALARLALQDGALAEAAAHVNALQPPTGEALVVLGLIQLQQGDNQAAATTFERARQAGGDPQQIRMGLGLAYLGQGQAAQAWEQFETAHDAQPDSPAAIHGLLRAGTALQWWRPLADRLMAYVERRPLDLAARFALASVWWRLGCQGAAKREYETIRRLNPAYEGLDALQMRVADAR